MKREITIELTAQFSSIASEIEELRSHRQYLIENAPARVTKWPEGFLAKQQVEGVQITTWLFMSKTIEPIFGVLEINIPSALFLYVAKGRLSCEFDKQRKVISIGQHRLIQLYLPAKRYKISMGAGLTVFYCFSLTEPFLIELSKEFPTLISSLQPSRDESIDNIRVTFGKINPGIIDDFIRLKADAKKGLGLQSVLHWLVLQLITQLKPNGSSSMLTTPEKTFYAKDYIDENVKFGAILTVGEIAERYSLHSDTLNRAFKSVFGVSLKKYINQVKMQEAHRLLTQEQMPVMLVAERLGYNNASSFSTQFRAHFNMTPTIAVSQYRNLSLNLP
nr:AraC family transcriptional regulator [uncultured Dyadobacter sp.]